MTDPATPPTSPHPAVGGTGLALPLGRIKEYVEVVRRLLAWEKLDHDGGSYDVHGYLLLMHTPQPPSPIVMGALNEQMLRAGGEVADGVCLNWIGAHAVGQALSPVKAGPRPTSNACFVRACVTDDVEAVRRWARRQVMSYVTVPAYRTAFGVQGWDDVTSRAMQLWDGGDVRRRPRRARRHDRGAGPKAVTAVPLTAAAERVGGAL